MASALACMLFLPLLFVDVARAGDSYAGYANLGDPISPTGGMIPTSSAEPPFVFGGENSLRVCLIDAQAGYGYVGTSDGSLVMWSLGNGVTAPVRIGAVPLTSLAVTCGGIDTQSRQLYVGAGSYLYQLQLGQGGALPTVLHTVPLGFTAGGPLLLDKARGHLYLTHPSGATLHKITLGTANLPPQLLGSVSLPYANPSVGILHPSRPEALLTYDSSPGRVTKISLGVTTGPPTVVGLLTLNSGEAQPVCGVLDASGENVYLGTRTVPGRIIKVGFGAVGGPPVRVHALTLPAGEDQLTAAVANPSLGHAWFASSPVYLTTNTQTVKLIKVGLVEGAAAPLRMAAASMPAGIYNSAALAMDSTSHQAWLATDEPGQIVKCALGTGIAPPSYLGRLMLNSLEKDMCALALDEQRGYAYLVTGFDFTPWVGLAWGPARIIKLRLRSPGESPLFVDDLVLEPHESYGMDAAVDAAGGYLYVTTLNSVLKLRLGEGDAPMVRVSTLQLPQYKLGRSGFDFSTRHGWLTAYPTKLVKIATGVGDSTPTLLGETAEIGAAQQLTYNHLLIDPIRRRGYAWTYQAGYSYSISLRRMSKFNLGDGDAPPSYITRTELIKSGGLYAGIIDVTSNTAHIDVNGSWPLKVDLGQPSAAPVSLEANPYIGSSYPDYMPMAFDRAQRGIYECGIDYMGIYLWRRMHTHTITGTIKTHGVPTLMAVDSRANMLYTYSSSSVGRLFKIALGHRDILRLSNITLPQGGELLRVGVSLHQPRGHMRLGLYREDEPGTHTLVWESASTTLTTGTAQFEIPASAGAPGTLPLAAGKYRLGLQLDSAGVAPGYTYAITAGSAYLPMTYGPMPARLVADGGAASPVNTTESWAAYVVYRASSGVETQVWTAYDAE